MSSRSLLNKGLPYDAEIEYLEGSGTQYIDTGIIPSSTIGYYFIFSLIRTTGSSDNGNAGTGEFILGPDVN